MEKCKNCEHCEPIPGTGFYCSKFSEQTDPEKHCIYSEPELTQPQKRDLQVDAGTSEPME